jgi:hypothetical protein
MCEDSRHPKRKKPKRREAAETHREPGAVWERQFDTAPDLIVTMDDSFNDPLDDFEPYMVVGEEPD